MGHLPYSDGLLSKLPVFDFDESEVLKQVQAVTEAGAFAAQLSDALSHRFFAHAIDRHFVS